MPDRRHHAPGACSRSGEQHEVVDRAIVADRPDRNASCCASRSSLQSILQVVQGCTIERSDHLVCSVRRTRNIGHTAPPSPDHFAACKNTWHAPLPSEGCLVNGTIARRANMRSSRFTKADIRASRSGCNVSCGSNFSGCRAFPSLPPMLPMRPIPDLGQRTYRGKPPIVGADPQRENTLRSAP